MPSKKKGDERSSGSGRIACEECGKTLASPWGLDAHIKTVHGQKVFSCEYCEKAFARKDHLVNHVRSIHTGLKRCTQCNLSFNGREGLAEHVAQHHPYLASLPRQPGTFFCPHCSKSFASKYKLKQHSFLVHQKVLVDIKSMEPRSLTPTSSGTPQASPSPAVPHIATTIQIQQAAVPLPKVKLINQVGGEESKKKESCACPVCKTLLETPEKLMKHVAAKHPGDAQNLEILYKCAFCSGTFLQSGFFGSQSIARHVREAHGPKKMVLQQSSLGYHCDVCKDNFSQISAYEDHVLQRHTWSRGGDQSQTKKRSVEEELNAHLGKKHRPNFTSTSADGSNNNVVLLICEFCDQLFTNEEHKEEHLREFHPFKEQGRLHYQCEICESLFDTEGHLDEHIEEDQSEKFRRLFLQSDQLFAHAVNDDDKFKCRECNDVFFDDAVALERHVAAVHPVPDDPENGRVKVFYQCVLSAKTYFKIVMLLNCIVEHFHQNPTNGVVHTSAEEEVKKIFLQVPRTGRSLQQKYSLNSVNMGSMGFPGVARA
ncbi:KRAB [Lepeophtheirus salmonis]|uniref:KRAB n=1 Tax=Lepeophtheirus salmonis TaxID=72036 RepID=A0A7R8CU92_LEPSM|nr:KRAB [Lepeophtheirus salmonis]CAF2934643.1 KRAB [Lepeophtheirus salmonis]